MSYEQWTDIQEIYRTLSGNEFQDMLERGIKPLYFLSAYKDWHPELPVITQSEADLVQMMRWGVIPFFAKYKFKDGKKLHPYDFGNSSAKTANCVSETMADPKKSTWNRLYQKNRCIVLASGFYEFYHMPGRKATYPHFITLKDYPVFGFAGLHSKWVDTETGEEVKTCTIITTRPNEMMKAIHNNPKAVNGPRMPVILTPEEWSAWLDGEMVYEDVMKFCEPFPVDGMNATPVRQGLMSTKVDTNIPAAQEPIDYPELAGGWQTYGDIKPPEQASLF